MELSLTSYILCVICEAHVESFGVGGQRADWSLRSLGLSGEIRLKYSAWSMLLASAKESAFKISLLENHGCCR